MVKMNEVASFLLPDSLRGRWGGDAVFIPTTEAREFMNSNGGIKDFLLQSEKFYRKINFLINRKIAEKISNLFVNF